MDIAEVEVRCCHYMQENIDPYNCVGIHLLADQYSCQEMEKYSMDYILEYFSIIYKMVSDVHVGYQLVGLLFSHIDSFLSPLLYLLL